MRVKGKHNTVSRVSLLRTIQRFEDDSQTMCRLIVARIKRQSALQIGHGRADLLHAEIGARACMISFGNIRRMICQRGQMFDGNHVIAPFQRVTSPLEQKIHRWRAGFAPFKANLPLQPSGLGLAGRCQIVIEPCQTIRRSHSLLPRKR